MTHGARITAPTDRQLAMMDPKDRPPGVAGKLASEIHAGAVAKAEKDLQKMISTELRRRRIYFINPPMHRRSTLPPGHPDFTILLPGAITIFWECKAVGGALRLDQIRMRDELRRLDFRWRLIRNFGEAVDHLRECSAGGGL